jgi:hypothetical protein
VLGVQAFYGRFCRRAVAEGALPPDMAHFIRYVTRWIDGPAGGAAAAAATM